MSVSCPASPPAPCPYCHPSESIPASASSPQPASQRAVTDTRVQQQLQFKDKVVIVTGAGGGLGKACASSAPVPVLLPPSRRPVPHIPPILSPPVTNCSPAHLPCTDSTFFASRGAHVLINDLSREAADKACAEINAKDGGRAVANYDSVTDGGKIVAQAMAEWGRVDVSAAQVPLSAGWDRSDCRDGL